MTIGEFILKLLFGCFAVCGVLCLAMFIVGGGGLLVIRAGEFFRNRRTP